MDKGAETYKSFLNGDDSALAIIIREYKDGLILYLNGIVDNIRTAEELTEDTFVKIGIKKPKYNIAKASFKTWLYTIARNTAFDYLRRRAKDTHLSIDDCAGISDERDIECSYITEERKRVLHRALRHISPQYRQILWLIYFENFSIRESAKIMKKSEHSIETLVYRARTALRSELEKEGVSYEELQ